MRRPLLTVIAMSMLVSPAYVSTAYAYKILDGDKWNIEDGPVPYVVDPAGSDDVDDGSDVEAIKSSLLSWNCVECSSLQFRYDGDAPARAVDDSDGYNTIYFVEQAADWPAGAGTLAASILGVCTGGGGPFDSDIVFNGADHTWSTDSPMSGGADIESISIHETGHMAGLGHPCEDDQNLATCVDSSTAVMYPQYPGGLIRQPLPDDIEGICSVFPPGKICDGLVLGSPCVENCECEQGLKCLLGEDGKRYCSVLCAGDDPKCPRGMACVLAARNGDYENPARGSCMRVNDINALPPSAACTRSTQCASRDCTLIRDLGRDACSVSCSSRSDCPDAYSCVDRKCLINRTDQGVPCKTKEKKEPECGCSGLSGGAVSLLAALLFAGLLLRRRQALPLVLLAAVALAPTAKASVVIPMDLDKMIELSDVIVHGHVVNVSARELNTGKNRYIFTVVHVRVEKAVWGCQRGEIVEVLVLGGELGDRKHVVPGTSSFAQGEEVVLFLSRWRDHLVPIAIGVGKIEIDRTDPDRVLINDPSRGVVEYEIDAQGRAIPQFRQAIPSIPLEDFVEELRARLEYR